MHTVDFYSVITRIKLYHLLNKRSLTDDPFQRRSLVETLLQDGCKEDQYKYQSLGLCGKKTPASLVGCAVRKGNQKTGSCRTALTHRLSSPNMFPPWLLEKESTVSQDNTMPCNFVVRTSSKVI